MGNNEIGVSIVITNDFFKDSEPGMVQFLFDEAVQKVLAKEAELTNESINPSSRKFH